MAKRSKRNTRSEQRPAAVVQTPTPLFFAWMRMDETVKHGICIGALALLALIFFASVNFSGKSVIGSDAVQAAGMRQSMVEYEEATGEEALWATNMFSGMPGYLIYYQLAVPQVDTIVRLLNKIVFPTFQFMVLLLGFYVLIFYLLKDRWVAVFSAAAFGLTTYLPLLLVAGHNTKFVALSYAPWLVLSFVYLLRNPKLLSSLLFAAVLAVNLRANHVQVTYYIAFLLGVWWLVEAVTAWRSGERTGFLHASGYLALGSVLAILMVAQPYWVVQEYKAYSMRGASEGGASGTLAWDYAMEWSQGWGEMLTLLIAQAYGGASEGLGQGYWGDKTFTAGPHYIGGVVILFAIFAIWRVRTRPVRALAIGTGLTLLFALGRNASFINWPMFEVFPLFSSFRVPETWLIASVFGLVMLAAWGMYAMFEKSSEDPRENQTAVFRVGGGMLGFLAILYLIGPSLFSFEAPNEVDQVAEAIAQQAQQQGQPGTAIDFRGQAIQYLDTAKSEPDGRIDRFTSDTLRTFLFVLLACALLLLFQKGLLPGWIAKAAIAILVMIDLGFVDARYYNDDRLSDEPDVEQLVASREYGVDRYIQQQVEVVGGPGYFRVLPLAFQPLADARSAYFYESIGGYHGAKLRVYQDYLEQLLFDPESGRLIENGMDLTSTRYLITQTELPGMRTVFEDPDVPLRVLERERYLPRVFMIGEAIHEDDSRQAWELLKSSDFNLRRQAIVAEPVSITPIDSTSTARVEMVSFDAHTIEWTVETDAPRLMVAAEVYYPAGWKAYIDDEETEIIQTNYVQRGVVVPAGTHTVRMEFDPYRHEMSIWISLFATLLVYGGIIAVLGWQFYTHRRENDTAGME